MAASQPLAPLPALTAQQLAALRCGSDRLGLPVLLVGASLLLALAPGFSLVGALLVALGLLQGALSFARLLGSAVPIGPTVAPAWHRAARLAYHRAGLTRRGLPLLLVQEPQANAWASWALPGRAVVVTSGLAALLADDLPAQAFVLAHEAGHALLHQPWFGLTHALSGLAGPLSPLLRVAWLWWSRGAERTADRLALAVCQSPRAATRALLALHAGACLGDDDLQATLRALPRRPAGLYGYLSEALATHPFLRPRLETLYAYAASPAFARLVGPETAEAARWELAGLGLRPDRLERCPWPS